MNKPSKREFRLFNCDHTYKLDVVEKLVKAIQSKVGIEFSVYQHYFPLSQMSELCLKTIPELHMDFAMFVVHANESRLSINEDKAGIGYAKVYRALLNATGDKVIIIIGGDNNYKNEDEEDRVVLSRWSRRKISSQFREEFLDGRKSFVLSWNEKHRPIHEEALLHYFDPKKAGQKFDYQPIRSDAKTDDVPTRKDAQQFSNIKVVKGDASCGGDVGKQRRNDRPIGTSKQQEKQGDITDHTAAQALRADMKSFCKDDQQTRIKELVIVGCHAADDSVRAVMKVIKDHLPELNLSIDPSFLCGTPVEMKSYLMKNVIKFCLLLLDAETVKATSVNVPQLKVEYEELLKTATECVAEKVLVAICGPPLLLPEDEETVTRAVNRILHEKEKGLIVWIKGEQLHMGRHALWDILKPIARARMSSKQVARDDSRICYQPLRESSQKDFVRSKSTNDVESYFPSFSSSLHSHDCQSRGSHVTSYYLDCGGGSSPSAFAPSSYSADFPRPRNDSSIRALKQSYGEGACDDQSMTYSADIGGAHQSSGQQSLGGQMSRYLSGYEGASDISSCRDSYQGEEHQAQGVMTAQTTHPLRGQRGWKHRLPEGELVTLVLKCHLRNGRIAVEEGDLKFPGWKVPDYIAKMLIDKYPTAPEAELLIFFDESGYLQTRVKLKSQLRKFNSLSGVSRKNVIPQTKLSTETLKELEQLLEPNESLMLKTCVRQGKVSFKSEDVEYWYPNWEVPRDVIEIVERNEWATSLGKLFLISDEKGTLRSLVHVGQLRSVHRFFNKLGHNVNRVTLG